MDFCALDDLFFTLAGANLFAMVMNYAVWPFAVTCVQFGAQFVRVRFRERCHATSAPVCVCVFTHAKCMRREIRRHQIESEMQSFAYIINIVYVRRAHTQQNAIEMRINATARPIRAHLVTRVFRAMKSNRASAKNNVGDAARSDCDSMPQGQGAPFAHA